MSREQSSELAFPYRITVLCSWYSDQHASSLRKTDRAGRLVSEVVHFRRPGIAKNRFDLDLATQAGVSPSTGSEHRVQAVNQDQSALFFRQRPQIRDSEGRSAGQGR